MAETAALRAEGSVLAAEPRFRHPSATGAKVPIADWADVEEGLVEARRLWARSPGGGRWPFAGDGPWHLVSREGNRGDWDARGVDGEAPPPRLRGLSVEEVARRDRASAWLTLLGEGERRLVLAVVEQLASGRARADFASLRSAFRNAHGAPMGSDGLRRRYRRALERLARTVRARGA